jgi:hypothetical protein
MLSSSAGAQLLPEARRWLRSLPGKQTGASDRCACDGRLSTIRRNLSRRTDNESRLPRTALTSRVLAA